MIIGRFAQVACPPQVRAAGRTDQVIGEFELLLGVTQPGPRRLLLLGFQVVDQRARLYPPARGRRLARLSDQVAADYLGGLLTGSGAVAGVAKRLKGLIVMSYYDLPEVHAEIGYQPAPYIAAVSKRRLDSYGDQIRAGERAVLAGTPLDPDRPAAQPGEQ